MRKDYKNYIMSYKKDREKEIIKTSLIGIIASVILAIFMISIGYISNSVAIILDGVEIISTALASIIILIGIKLSAKSPDKKHPYGYGRIEYISDMIVSFIILYIGIMALKTEITTIMNPSTPQYSAYTFIILSVSMVVKFLLGIHEKEVAKKTHSRALAGASADSFANAIVSFSIIISSIIFIYYDINIENYIGLIISLLIIRIGFTILKNTISDILGTTIHSKLNDKIKKTISEFNNVIGVYDLVLHSYGRHKYIGTVYIEISSEMSMTDFELLQINIIEKIYLEYSVIISAIGVYAIDLNNAEFMEVYNDINDLVDNSTALDDAHGIFINKEKKKIYFDVVVDCTVENQGEILSKIKKELENKHQGYEVVIQKDMPL